MAGRRKAKHHPKKAPRQSSRDVVNTTYRARKKAMEEELIKEVNSKRALLGLDEVSLTLPHGYNFKGQRLQYSIIMLYVDTIEIFADETYMYLRRVLFGSGDLAI